MPRGTFPPDQLGFWVELGCFGDDSQFNIQAVSNKVKKNNSTLGILLDKICLKKEENKQEKDDEEVSNLE